MNQQTDYISGAQFRPRNDNVLIKWAPIPETTPSGLLALPKSDYAREIDGKLAVVVAVGDGPAYTRKCVHCGHPLDPYAMEVKPGDRVIVDGRLVGEIIVFEGQECRVVRQAELLAVVE
jgi:co-chaperonin GroES (HSP10)